MFPTTHELVDYINREIDKTRKNCITQPENFLHLSFRDNCSNTTCKDTIHTFQYALCNTKQGPPVFDNYYNGDKNILVSVPHKGGSTTLRDYFLSNPDLGYIRIFPKVADYEIGAENYLQQILENNPSRHTVLRDPISRYASGIKMTYNQFVNKGAYIDIDTFLGLTDIRFSQDGHLIPQYIGTPIKTCLEEIVEVTQKQYLKNLDKLQGKMFGEVIRLSKLTRSRDFFRVMLSSWYLNNESYNVQKANNLGKFYWVWDDPRVTKRFDMLDDRTQKDFKYNNYFAHLLTNIGIEPTERDASRIMLQDTGYPTSQFINDKQHYFLGVKKLFKYDYQWMNQLNFVNTPEGKPQFTF